MRETTLARLAALAAAIALAAPAAQAAGAHPDLSGTWTFVQKRSDDLREKIDLAVGPASTSGDIKKDSARVWIRSWLMGVTERPDAGILTIEQTPAEFHSGTGDDVRIYAFDRPRTRQGEGGGKLGAGRVRHAMRRPRAALRAEGTMIGRMPVASVHPGFCLPVPCLSVRRHHNR